MCTCLSQKHAWYSPGCSPSRGQLLLPTIIAVDPPMTEFVDSRHALLHATMTIYHLHQVTATNNFPPNCVGRKNERIRIIRGRWGYLPTTSLCGYNNRNPSGKQSSSWKLSCVKEWRNSFFLLTVFFTCYLIRTMQHVAKLIWQTANDI